MLYVSCCRNLVLIFCVVAVSGQQSEGDSCYESNTRSYGICTRSNQCFAAYMAYVNRNIRFDMCGYLYDMPIVCCVENLMQANNNPSPTGQSQSFRPRRPVQQTFTPSQTPWRPESQVISRPSQTPSRPESQATFRPSQMRSRPESQAISIPSQTPSRTKSQAASRPFQTPSRPVLQTTSIPTPQTSRPSSKPTEQNNRQKRICEEKCKEYSASVTETYGVISLSLDAVATIFEQPKCDYVANPLVVGGEVADLGEFPHMAAVGWPKVSSDGYAWLCGGSLISDRYVLTAGHCTFQSANENAESGPPQVVRLGDHDLRDDVVDKAQPVTVKIESIIKNPGYKTLIKYHDIALLRLEESLEFSNFVRPACLYLNEPPVGKSVIATGWGTTSNRGSNTSDVLRKVALTVFDNAECQPNFQINRNWRDGFSTDQMCAGDERGDKDTCQGDSGGPLQVESTENSCIFYIVGVTGFGKFCGDRKGSGVYAVVSHYLDWIEDEVWRKNQ